MQKTRPLRHGVALTVALGLALHLAAPHRMADACSIAGHTTPGLVLGTPSYGTSFAPVPANAASLDSTRGELLLSAGATLYRIPAGTTEIVVSEGVVIPVSDVPDTSAPSVSLDAVSWVRESACSGCAYGGVDSSNATLTLSASDDRAGAAELTYAVYLGATAEDARAAADGEPELWILPDETDGRVWFFVREADVPSFVVVRAFDQAGNASPASEARAIDE